MSDKCDHRPPAIDWAAPEPDLTRVTISDTLTGEVLAEGYVKLIDGVWWIVTESGEPIKRAGGEDNSVRVVDPGMI